MLWAMHPWERDARFLKEALTGREASNVIIEIACTRSADELLGARKAYHSLFDHSIEEDVASNVRGHERKVRELSYSFPTISLYHIGILCEHNHMFHY